MSKIADLNDGPDAKDGPPSGEEDTVRERVEPTLSQGTKVGDYVIDTILGEGGFGKVYSATHPLIGKRAAIKVLNKDLSSDPEMVSRFVTEARAVNTIRHQNIVDIFNIGVLPDGRHYFVMQLLDGTSLEEELCERVRLHPTELLRIIEGIASALDAAHAHGIVHRDIKPDNIFLHREPNGTMTPKLVDFGVAKLTGAAQSMSQHQTATGTPIGTPRYMSPEQCFAKGVDHRTDIYALGVVCFEALTGYAPFDADSLLALMNMHTSAPRPRASDVCPAIGTVFDAPLAKMLAIDPAERPNRASEAIEEIAAAASGHVPAGPTAPYARRGAFTPTDVARPVPASEHDSSGGPAARSNPKMTEVMAEASSPGYLPREGQAVTTVDASASLAKRSSTTLGATAAGVKLARRDNKRMVWALAGAVMLTVVGVVVAVSLVSSPPTNAAAVETASTEVAGDSSAVVLAPNEVGSPAPSGPASALSPASPASGPSAGPSAAVSTTPAASASAKSPPTRKWRPPRPSGKRRRRASSRSDPYDHP